MPAIRPSFHLTPCSKFRSHLSELLKPLTFRLLTAAPSTRAPLLFRTRAGKHLLGCRGRSGGEEKKAAPTGGRARARVHTEVLCTTASATPGRWASIWSPRAPHWRYL